MDALFFGEGERGWFAAQSGPQLHGFTIGAVSNDDNGMRQLHQVAIEQVIQ